MLGRVYMRIGYIRVSDRDQNPGRQIEKMKTLGIEDRFIFIDKQSGKNFNRPQYQHMKQIIREGDLLYIDSLDRLGRNYDGIISEWKEITRRMNADIVVLDNEHLFDSRKFKEMGGIGKLMEDQFLSLLSYVAEQERNKIRQRQREGIDLALAKGVRFGRPKHPITSAFIDAYNQWKAGKITAVAAMKSVNMTPSTFYRKVREYKTNVPMNDSHF